MDADQPDGNADVQHQIDDLRARADAADLRASASESRADKAELPADDGATRADEAEGRRTRRTCGRGMTVAGSQASRADSTSTTR
jgi:hypothetical protein